MLRPSTVLRGSVTCDRGGCSSALFFQHGDVVAVTSSGIARVLPKNLPGGYYSVLPIAVVGGSKSQHFWRLHSLLLNIPHMLAGGQKNMRTRQMGIVGPR